MALAARPCWRRGCWGCWARLGPPVDRGEVRLRQPSIKLAVHDAGRAPRRWSAAWGLLLLLLGAVLLGGCDDPTAPTATPIVPTPAPPTATLRPAPPTDTITLAPPT